MLVCKAKGGGRGAGAEMWSKHKRDAENGERNTTHIRLLEEPVHQIRTERITSDMN